MQLPYWLVSYKTCPYEDFDLVISVIKFDRTIHVSDEFMKTSSWEDPSSMSKYPQKFCPSYEIADIPRSKTVVEKKGEKKKISGLFRLQI